MKTSQPSACTSIGTCAAYCTASTQQSAPAACASSETRATSTIVPTAFDDATHATTRTRSSSFRSRSSRSRRSSGVTSIQSTSKPRSAASSTHGDDAAVVVEPRDEDPVALAPVARRGAREREVEHRHVRPKITSSAEQLRKRAASSRAVAEDPLDALARLVERADVRASLAQGARDRVADLVGHLRAAGRVEEDEAAVPQRGEARAHGLDVQ